MTTGLLGSYHEPWISQMCSCGKPAFCGNPSWFCCTHECTTPCCPSSPSATCVGVGAASRVFDIQPCLFAPLRAACPMTDAEMPAPV